MVKDPDRRISLAYAVANVRPRLELAFVLDEALADILRNVREPMIARIRLAWWREQLEGLARGGETSAEPLLRDIAIHFAPSEVTPLSHLPDAWEMLLDDPLCTTSVTRFAEGRGRALASVFHDPSLTTALAFWGLVDFAFHCSEADLAEHVRAEAQGRMPEDLKPLPRPVRVLVGLAQHDLAQPDARRPGSPARLWRAFRLAMLAV